MDKWTEMKVQLRMSNAYLLLLVLVSFTYAASGDNVSISLSESLETRQDSNEMKWYTMPHTHDLLFKSTPTLLMTYYITGYIPPNAAKFTVELCPESICFPVKALHISVRLNHQVIVRSHRLENGWGKEERKGEMPFTRGANFKMKITATKLNYQLHVDGRYFSKYNYFVPIEKIGFIKVYGDVHINRTSIGCTLSRQANALFSLDLRRHITPGDWIRHEMYTRKSALSYSFIIGNSETVGFQIKGTKGENMTVNSNANDDTELGLTFTDDAKINIATEFEADGEIKIYNGTQLMKTFKVSNLERLNASTMISFSDVAYVESFRNP